MAATESPGGLRGLGADYWKVWGASVVSNLGDGVALIAFPWLATTLTRDPLAIALLGLATRLPWLLFSLPAGVITDRSDRRRLMVVMNTLRAVVTVGVGLAVLADAMTLPLLYAAALALGCAEVLFDNSSQTILPAVVARDRLERANGNLWGGQLVMNDFVGAPLAGFLIAIGLALPFFVDAGTAVASVALLLLLRGSYRAGAGATGGPRPSMRADISEGFRWLWSHRLLRTLALMLGALNALSAAAMATYVLFVQEVLGLGSRGFGILTTAGAAGGILGTQVAAGLTRRIGPGPSLFVSVVGMGLGLAVTGLTSNAVVVAGAFVLSSFLVALWNVITVSLRQSIIPDRLLGRVNSVYRFFGWGMLPLGTLLGGGLVTLTSALGTRELGLRMPFLLGALFHGVLLFVALSRLTTQQIEAAKAAAEEGIAAHRARPDAR